MALAAAAAVTIVPGTTRLSRRQAISRLLSRIPGHGNSAQSKLIKPAETPIPRRKSRHASHVTLPREIEGHSIHNYARSMMIVARCHNSITHGG
jgi:hypothetical protein